MSDGGGGFHARENATDRASFSRRARPRRDFVNIVVIHVRGCSYSDSPPRNGKRAIATGTFATASAPMFALAVRADFLATSRPNLVYKTTVSDQSRSRPRNVRISQQIDESSSRRVSRHPTNHIVPHAARRDAARFATFRIFTTDTLTHHKCILHS